MFQLVGNGMEGEMPTIEVLESETQSGAWRPWRVERPNGRPTHEWRRDDVEMFAGGMARCAARDSRTMPTLGWLWWITKADQNGRSTFHVKNGELTAHTSEALVLTEAIRSFGSEPHEGTTGELNLSEADWARCRQLDVHRA